MRVLLVEKFRSSVTSRIGDDLGVVVCAEDADEAMVLLQQDFYDLVLLNMSSTAQDGLSLIRRLRAAANDTPVLAMTAPLTADRAEALRLGVDDVLADPVSLGELRARMTSLFQSSRGNRRSLLRLGELSLCLGARDAQFRGVPVKLTPKEFSMLELLVRRKGSVLTKTTFLNYLYSGCDRPESRIIDLFLCKLRKKLERAGASGLIVTVWGNGYMICDPDVRRQGVDNVMAAPACRLVA
jgi:two-component system cell cycle response regulator CtrA